MQTRFNLPLTQTSLCPYLYSDRFLSKSKFEVASYSFLNKRLPQFQSNFDLMDTYFSVFYCMDVFPGFPRFTLLSDFLLLLRLWLTSWEHGRLGMDPRLALECEVCSAVCSPRSKSSTSKTLRLLDDILDCTKRLLRTRIWHQ